ncbi:sulfotransferase family protein [Acrocarpospora catenulata]|uniref:sulfotransferase family protein n=1 Tax=Acrocarpospora catenulata TaxID=2836182 RepID=UPI001BDB3A46|nr:sulfotransferase [Acrocarpospora catenulata]
MLTKPIFIVGHPRSGTSLVRSLLERSDQIWTIGREGKPIWERHLHPSTRDWHSNELTAADATPELAATLRDELLAACRRPGVEWAMADKLDFLHFMSAQGIRPYYYDVPFAVLKEHFPEVPPEGPPTAPNGDELDEITPFCFPPRGPRPTADQLADGIRLVEKSIQSCFRVPFLREVFPDAKYVFVVRDPRSSIGSLMDAWLNPRMFFSYRMPVPLRIEGYSDVFPWGKEWWNLSLPPGWEDWIGLRLEEVCALSWLTHNQAVLQAAETLADDAILVRYEDVKADPATTFAHIAETVDLPFADAWHSTELPIVMTQTRPDPNKWCRHEPKITSVLPLITDLSTRLGY